MKEHGNRITYANQGCGSCLRPHGYRNGSTLTGHIDEASELMARVVHGDGDAFDRLYNEFNPVLRRLFGNNGNHRRISLDDFIQEVFTRLWEQRKNYRGTSGFRTYLLGIARYTLSERLRRSYKVNITRIECLEKLASFTLDSHDALTQPEAEFYLDELTSAFKEAKAKLTTKQRQALELSQAEETSIHKASQKLGCSPEALRCRLKRARKRSRDLLAPILSS